MMNQISVYDPLTSENAALVLVDHQVGLMTGVRDYSTGELKHNVVALAKAAKALNLPIVVTTTARDSMWGPTFPELVEALPGIEIIDRSSVNAFDDARVARAIEATGRKKLIFAGISLEVCAAFPAITAVGKGLDAYVAVDASGAFSETKRQTGVRISAPASGRASLLSGTMNHMTTFQEDSDEWRGDRTSRMGSGPRRCMEERLKCSRHATTRRRPAPSFRGTQTGFIRTSRTRPPPKVPRKHLSLSSVRFATRFAITFGDQSPGRESKERCYGAVDSHSDSFTEAAPNSLSNSSIVGRLLFNFSGRLSASRYSDMPMGLLMSRKVYSAMKRSRVLHRIIPMLGWSSG
jgi:nicotinamidase-related amidase